MNISKGKIRTAQKVVIYGPEGVGKSTFASHFPSPIFIDTEGGTKKLDVTRFDRPTSWEMLLQQIEYVKQNGFDFKTLVIDTADWAEKLAVQNVCSRARKKGIEDFNYGKGYTYLSDEFGKMLNLLEDLIEIGINVVVTAHAKMNKVEQPDEMGSYDRWELKLSKQCSPLLKEWADTLIFANYKTIVEKTEDKKYKARGGQQRIMYTTHSACWDAKNRDDMEDVLPLDYSYIASFIENVENLPAHNLQNTVIADTNKNVLPVEIQKKENADRVSVEPQTEPLKEKTNILPPVEVAENKTDNTELPNYVPKALRDLMKINNVTLEDIEDVVSKRGYFPEGTPFQNYPADFINDCLIGAWDQVYKLILCEKDLPF